MYIGGDKYELFTKEGQTLTVTKDEVLEMLQEIARLEDDNRIGDHVETADYNKVYYDGDVQKSKNELETYISVGEPYETLEATIEELMDKSITEALDTARSHYEVNYIMVPR